MQMRAGGGLSSDPPAFPFRNRDKTPQGVMHAGLEMIKMKVGCMYQQAGSKVYN